MEDTMTGMKRFSQQDPQWKARLLGFDPECTIGNYGCLLTSIAMVCTKYGFDVDPGSLNDKMKSINAFQGAMIMPSAVGAALSGMIYRNYEVCSGQPAPLTEIDAWLGTGKPVIVEVDFSPKPGLQNHWIVLTGKQGGDYLIADPWPYPLDAGPVTLAARFGFAGSAAQTIQAVLMLDGPSGTVTPPPIDTSVVASFKVYAASDNLALRSQPLVADSTLLERLPINTALTVLETDTSAAAKVGQMNQWLTVQAPDGTNGYVAAWYVSRSQQTVPAASGGTQPAASGTALVVRTTTDCVALRSAPQITDATLVKRLPLGSQLQVMEDAAAAQAKIGVVNQWLQVQDITGTGGVVAAWYVALSTGDPALGAKNQVSTLPAGDVPVLLRTTQANVALRSAPLMVDDTIIVDMALGTELQALDDPDQVKGRIGQAGQWIRARDVAGQEGYVPAWYVVLRPADPVPVAGHSNT
jgi:hypothetical protein